MLLGVLKSSAYIAKRFAPKHPALPEMCVVITAEQKKGQREKQEQKSGRNESGNSSAMPGKRHGASQKADHIVGECPDHRNGAGEKRKSEKHAGDRPDVAKRRSNSRKPPTVMNRSQLRHHRVVERLRSLIGVIGSRERCQHAEEREARYSTAAWIWIDDSFADQRKPGLAKNGHYHECDTGDDGEADHPGLSSLSDVGDSAEKRN